MTSENQFSEKLKWTYFPNTLKNRFYRRISLPNENGCMIFSGGRDSGSGHIRIRFENKRILSHRLSYEMFNGPITKENFVCHSCDNPRCVAPTHLWLGSSKENNQDRAKKGRSARHIGEKNGGDKLTEKQVIQIKKLLENQNANQREIARKFSIHYNAIWKIKHKLKWAHIQ